MANGPTLQLQRGDAAGNNSVKISNATQRSQVNAIGNTPMASGKQFSNDIGNSLMRLGNSLDKVGDAVTLGNTADFKMQELEVQREKEKQSLSASTNASESTLLLQADFQQQQADAKDGASGFASTIESRINTHIEDATKDATPYYAEQYRKAMAPVKQHLLGAAIDYQANEGMKYEVDQIGTKVDNSSKAVNADPALYDAMLLETTSTINSNTKLKPDARRDLIQKARGQLNVAAGYGYINAAPIITLNEIKDAGGDFHMPDIPAVGKYSEAINTAASRTGVSPAILTAQIGAESGGNSKAISPKGARGVSQFMPETAKRYNVDVDDPVSSIVGQARYMGDLLNQFHGDYTMALAGYNWGEGNVAKAQGKYGADWLLHAPKETQDYVAKIMKATGGNHDMHMPMPNVGVDVTDLQIDPATVDSTNWDKREDGSKKGNGFLGLLKRPDGSVSSEISVGVEVNGKDMEVPLLVPTLTRAEVDQLINNPVDDPKKIPDAIVDKAVAFAEKRVAAGKSPFASPEESPTYGKQASATVPMQLSGHAWFDNASIEDQQKMKQYAETKANGQISNIAIDVATKTADSMVGDKPMDAEAVAKITIANMQAGGVTLTKDQEKNATAAAYSAVSRAETNWNRQRQGQTATALEVLDRTGGDVAALQAQQPELWASMTPKQRKDASEYGGAVQAGGNIITNWEVYGSLSNDPSLLKATNLDSLRGQLNARELVQLKTMQKAIKENPVAEDNIRSTQEVVKTQLAQAGIGPKNDKDKEGKASQDRFFSTLQTTIDQQLVATGKKSLTQQETLDLTNKLLVKVITDKSFWSTKTTTLGQLEVPATERQKIVSALNERRMPITELNILRAYQNKLIKDNGEAK